MFSSDDDTDHSVVLAILFAVVAAIIGLVIGLGIYKTRAPKAGAAPDLVHVVQANGLTGKGEARPGESVVAH